MRRASSPSCGLRVSGEYYVFNFHFLPKGYLKKYKRGAESFVFVVLNFPPIICFCEQKEHGTK